MPELVTLDGRLGGRPWSERVPKEEPNHFRHPGEGRDPVKPVIWARTPLLGMSS